MVCIITMCLVSNSPNPNATITTRIVNPNAAPVANGWYF